MTGSVVVSSGIFWVVLMPSLSYTVWRFCCWFIDLGEDEVDVRYEETFLIEEAKSSEIRLTIDDGDDCGAHVGIQRHLRAVLTGRDEVLGSFRDALGPEL